MSAFGGNSGDESRLISRMVSEARSKLVRPSSRRPSPWEERSRSPSPSVHQLPFRNPSPPPIVLEPGDLRHAISREVRDRSPRRRFIDPLTDEGLRRDRSRSGAAAAPPPRTSASAAPPAMMGDLLRAMDGMREDIAVLSRHSVSAG